MDFAKLLRDREYSEAHVPPLTMNEKQVELEVRIEMANSEQRVRRSNFFVAGLYSPSSSSSFIRVYERDGLSLALLRKITAVSFAGMGFDFWVEGVLFLIAHVAARN